MTSAEKKQSIYRAQALEHYMRSQQKTVLLRPLASRTILFMWILLVLFSAVWALLWEHTIPLYTTGSGVLQAENRSNTVNQRGMAAIVFVPAQPAMALQSGLSTQLHISMGTQKVMFTGQIERILPGIASPEHLRNTYALRGVDALLVTQPSIVVIVRVTSPASVAALYAGSSVKAQIQTGEQPLLSLLFRTVGQ